MQSKETGLRCSYHI